MTPQQIQNKLEEMKGMSFTYADQTHHAVSYKVNAADKIFQLNTHLKTFKRSFSDAEKFFALWISLPGQEAKETPVEKVNAIETASPSEENSHAVVTVDVIKGDNLADELVKILRDNIQKVKTTPGYIQQAQAISSSVSQIINIERLRLDMHKQLNGKKNN